MSRSSHVAAEEAAPAFRGRASWSGLLRFSLVAVPVKAYPAVSTTEEVHLNQLHRDCGQRIRYEKHCPTHGKVEADAIVRGYQYAPDQYVMIEPEELENIRPVKDKALTLQQFVEPDQLDPMRFAGRTLYLLPDGRAAHRPYQMLAEAFQQRGRWAVGRVTMSGHRYPVVVRPTKNLLSLHVLHDPAKLRASSGYRSQLRSEPVSDEEVQLARTLIDAATGPIDWSGYRDDTAQQLERLVDAKVAGREPVAAADEEPVQVIQLLTALRESVATQKGSKVRSRQTKRPARRRSA